MKKVKIISFIVLTLCLATVFASCGKVSFLKNLNDEFDETPTIGSGAVSEVLKDVGGIRSSSGNLITFFEYVEPYNSAMLDALVYDSVYRIYNLKTDSIVATLTTDYQHYTTITYGSISDVEYFIAETSNYSGVVTGATLYNSNGAVIASTTVDPKYKQLCDDFKFGGKIFSTDKNGEIVELGDASGFFDYTSVTAAGEDFMYVVGSSAIAVYDKFGNALSSYPVKTHLNYTVLYSSVSSSSIFSSDSDIPRTDADVYYPATDILIPSQISSRSLGDMSYTFKCGALRNGNIYIQYLVKLPDDAEDYDVYFENKSNVSITTPDIYSSSSVILPTTSTATDAEPAKYNIITEIFDIRDGSVKEVDVDFMIEKVIYNEDLEGAYATKDDFKDNLARIRRIDNKGAAVSELVVLDNKLKIKSTSNDIIGGIAVSDIKCVADSTFFVKDTLGRMHFVVDGVAMQTLSAANYNEKYIYTDQTVYNYELTALYDLAANNYTVLKAGATSLVVGTKSGGNVTAAVIYTNTGSVVTLIAPDSTSTSYLVYENGLYAVSRTTEEGKTVFDYYNEAGTLLGTYDKLFDLTICSPDGTVLAQSGETYYRFGTVAAN